MVLRTKLHYVAIVILLSSCSAVGPETPASSTDIVAASTNTLDGTADQSISSTQDEMLVTSTQEPNELPLFCREQNIDVEELVYEMYGFGDQACRNIVYSPDDYHLALLTLDRIEESPNEFGVGPVVYIVDTRSQELVRIYESKRGFIVHINWSSDGHLVVSDTNIDGCRGETYIFEKTQFSEEFVIGGVASNENWNKDRTAFFTVQKCSPYWATTDYLSGYFFNASSTFPEINTQYEDSAGIHITNGPDWGDEGSTLMVEIREGNWINDSIDYLLRNSYILVIGIEGDTPGIIKTIFDPAIDFSYQISSEGETQISSSPYEPFFYDW